MHPVTLNELRGSLFSCTRTGEKAQDEQYRKGQIFLMLRVYHLTCIFTLNRLRMRIFNPLTGFLKTLPAIVQTLVIILSALPAFSRICRGEPVCSPLALSSFFLFGQTRRSALQSRQKRYRVILNKLIRQSVSGWIEALKDRREFIRRVFQGEQSDRIPRALFGAGRWTYRQTGLKIENIADNPARFAESLACFFGELDTDIVFPGSGLNTFPAEAIGGVLAFNGDQAPLLSFPLIQKTEDAACLEKVDISASPRALALVEMIARLRELLPDRYLCVTSWGPFTWAMILCDWTLLKEKTFSDRTFVREVCELGVRLSTALFEPLIERRLIDGITISDGAATLIPIDLYREVVLPCERKLFELAGKHGLGGILHQCGDISSQLALYPETGADCISVDATVPLAEAYKVYGERVVLAGNVDVVDTVFGGDHEQLCKAVSECIAGIPDPYRRYVLMPSCDLPPDTPMRKAKDFLACADLKG
jgi:uroporphyrinogen decarboxylase